jgi:nicotinamidase-related amidase
MTQRLPIPGHFDPSKVGEVWRVPYADLAPQAEAWAKLHGIRPAQEDAFRVGLLIIDGQNTFCIPEYELFVAGRSGRGAIEDNVRLAQFIYEHLGTLSGIAFTLDTHRAIHIFHPIFWVDAGGQHPPAGTVIALADVREGRWKVNPSIAATLKKSYGYLEAYALHYVARLTEQEKYPLMIWPYHAQLRGTGHAMVSSLDEALFFHEIARATEGPLGLKGLNRFAEFYSAIHPEVRADQEGTPLVNESGVAEFQEAIYSFDRLIAAGQAGSHCVPWTVQSIIERNPAFASKIYLLEDCMSPVVIPGVVDFTDAQEDALRKFEAAGAHRVRSTEPMETWPGMLPAAA